MSKVTHLNSVLYLIRCPLLEDIDTVHACFFLCLETAWQFPTKNGLVEDLILDRQFAF